MALTFLLTSFFWFQEATQLYIGQKKDEMRLQIQQYLAASGKQADAPSALVLLRTALGRSGATDGCVLLENERIFCTEQAGPQADAMRSLLKGAAADLRPVSVLTGLVWLGPLPARQHLDLAEPLSGPEMDTILVLRYPLAPLYEKLHPLLRYAGIYLVVNLLILLIVGFFRMHRDVLRPIEELIHTADAYTEKEGVPFLRLSGRDEFGQLGHSIQRMLKRIQSDRDKLESNLASLAEANQRLLASQKEMVRTEKLSSIGQLAAGLAHEIGNPLSIVQGYLGLLRDEGLAPEQRVDYLGRADKELERINQLIRQLLDYSRPTSDDRVVDVHKVLRDALELLRPQPFLRGIALITRFAEQAMPVYGNSAQLTQVFLNCLMNAADAIHAGTGAGQGSIELRSRLREARGRTMAHLEIADTGAGLSGPALESALDPFFTTKGQGRGTGLGLSVSSALLRDMGGDITLANQEEGGALVTIELPLYRGEEETPAAGT